MPYGSLCWVCLKTRPPSRLPGPSSDSFWPTYGANYHALLQFGHRLASNGTGSPVSACRPSGRMSPFRKLPDAGSDAPLRHAPLPPSTPCAVASGFYRSPPAPTILTDPCTRAEGPSCASVSDKNRHQTKTGIAQRRRGIPIRGARFMEDRHTSHSPSKANGGEPQSGGLEVATPLGPGIQRARTGPLVPRGFTGAAA